ncbi:MAG: flagellin FliC, partial [Betaproteobacteria bacterium]|nr:flagellin FliC [Betaproteobacteria bacterium]
MASVLNTNMASISAQRYLTTAQSKLAASFEKLSSGSRINRAQDDAAGMGISQKLTASINATSMAMRNANDAVGVIQTAEGALSEISSMLQRFKELSVQGANAALSDTQRGFLATEMNGLKSEITAISTRTKFNDSPLLNTASTLTFQTGEGTTDTLSVVTVNIASTNGFAQVKALLTDTTYSSTAITNSTLGVSTVGVAAFSGLAGTIDSAINEIATQRATFGAQVNRLGHNLNNLAALYENLSAANSRVLDTDYANETANLTKTQILQQAA